jgi:hypothetical protein
MTTPKPSSPLAEVEVPKGVVDSCGLPIKYARDLPLDGKKLILMEVAVHENMRQLRGHLHPLAPLLDSIGASEAIRSFPNGLPSCSWVKCTAQPATVRAIVMGGWPGAG